MLSLGGSVLGDGLGSLGDGVLGELSWEDEPDSGLDLSGGHSWLLAVPGELGGLGGDLLELLAYHWYVDQRLVLDPQARRRRQNGL